jgi:hypothetical protein
MKTGLKMHKKVAGDYSQKFVNKAGKCIPYTLNKGEECNTRALQDLYMPESD